MADRSKASTLESYDNKSNPLMLFNHEMLANQVSIRIAVPSENQVKVANLY